MIEVAKLLDDRSETETLMEEIYDFEESLAKVSRSTIYLNTITISDLSNSVGWTVFSSALVRTKKTTDSLIGEATNDPFKIYVEEV